MINYGKIMREKEPTDDISQAQIDGETLNNSEADKNQIPVKLVSLKISRFTGLYAEKVIMLHLVIFS